MITLKSKIYIQIIFSIKMNNKNTIQLFENESISCSDAKLKPFSHAVDFIEKSNENGSELLSLNRKGLRAKQMVGLIQVKDISIEILPKMYKEDVRSYES